MASLPFKLTIKLADGSAPSATSAMPAQQQVAENKRQLSQTNSFSYPEDLNDVFMSFQFYDYRTILGDGSASYKINRNGTEVDDDLARQIYNANKSNVDEAIKKSKFAQIMLPIPAGLVDSFRVDYRNTSLGVTADIATMLRGTWNSIVQGNQTVDSVLSQFNLEALKGNLGQSFPDAQRLAFRALLTGQSQEIRDLYDLSTGVATNPNLAVIFQGPTLKQHSFQWRVSARSQTEATNLEKIIGLFKRAMHPTHDNGSTMFLKYPAEVLPQFHGPGNSFLYPMRPCVVEDFSINYGPNGIPTFFHDGRPTTLELNLRLQETSYYTRESFSAPEYGNDGLGDLTAGELNTQLGPEKGGN